MDPKFCYVRPLSYLHINTNQAYPQYSNLTPWYIIITQCAFRKAILTYFILLTLQRKNFAYGLIHGYLIDTVLNITILKAYKNQHDSFRPNSEPWCMTTAVCAFRKAFFCVTSRFNLSSTLDGVTRQIMRTCFTCSSQAYISQ